MMKNIIGISLTVIFSLIVHPANSGESLQVVTVSPFKSNLYQVTCIGGAEFNLPLYGATSIASVGDDGILIVDAGFVSTGETLKAELQKLGKLRKIITTHYHWDHSKGNQFLKEDGVEIISHQSLIERLSGKYFNLPGTPDPCRPTKGIDDYLEFPFNGETIKIYTVFNCHSGADLYVYFTESKVVAVGDLLFTDEFPFVDLNDGGSIAGYHQQIKKFISDFPDDVVFVPAHGRSCTKKDLIEYDKMMTTTILEVNLAINRGMTLEDMIEENILTFWTNKWNGSFNTTQYDDWIRTIYNELTAGSDDNKMSVCEPLSETLVIGSAQEAVKRFHQLKDKDPDKYDFSEGQINMLGYQLLMRDRVDDARVIFELNVKENPNSSNVYDSYGEILLAQGDTANSIINYQKSLDLNPDNTNARDILLKIK